VSTLANKIINANFSLPDGETLEAVLPKLLTSLGSPDAKQRDDALSVFNNWLESHKFPKDWLNGILLEKSFEGMRFELGSVGGDSVFVRSYYALLLLELLHHHLRDPFFIKSEFLKIHRVVIHQLSYEQDYRAVVEAKGWAYAVPHIADNFWKLVQTDALEPRHHEEILQAIGAKLHNTGKHIFEFLEDERLAYVTLATLKQGLITPGFFEGWVTQLVTLRNAGNTYLAIVELPAEQHAAYCNVRAFLRSLYFQLSFRDKPPQDAERFSAAIENGIRRLDPGFQTTF